MVLRRKVKVSWLLKIQNLIMINFDIFSDHTLLRRKILDLRAAMSTTELHSAGNIGWDHPKLKEQVKTLNTIHEGSWCEAYIHTHFELSKQDHISNYREDNRKL